jgi:SAM-dependent methyltransferase
MFDPATTYTLDFVRSALPTGAKHIVEVGCGQGALAARLTADGFSVTAIDSDDACVAAARAKGIDARLAIWPEFSGRDFDAVLFTRSLHHIDVLDAGICAAFDCLTDKGCLIVEDFDAAFCDQQTESWFKGLVRTLSAGGIAFEPESWAAGQLGSPPTDLPEEDHHHLHSAAQIEEALGRLGSISLAETSAYFFRYFDSASVNAETISAAVLAQELEAIGLRHIAPLGRRFVATRRNHGL